MVKFLYISLVGTSILRNTGVQVRENWADVFIDVDKWFNLPLNDIRNIYPDGLLCRLRELKPRLFSDFVDAARKIGRDASAEISGILGIRSVFNHSVEGIEIALYPTKTCTSILSAEINREILRDQGYINIDVIPLEGFENPEEFEKGVIELLDKIISRISEARKRGIRVYVNATPGFKAETSFLVLASILTGVNAVLYIHETFREPITLPIPPIKLDFEELKHILDLGDRIPREVFSTINHYTRNLLLERGVVRFTGEYYEVREWVKKLLEIMRYQ